MNMQIAQLENQIHELRYKRIIKSNMIKILKENPQKVKELEKEIEEINFQLEPLENEFKGLCYHYYVAFECEVLNPIGDSTTKCPFERTMYSQINCDVDTFIEESSVEIPNYIDLLEEFAQKLSNEFSNVWFTRIKKLKDKAN